MRNQLTDILAGLADSGESTKQASAKAEPAPKTAQAKDEFMNVLKEAVRETTKEASANPQENVTEGLSKIASDLAASEDKALIKQASLYGAAMADGFMARLNQYSDALPAGEKTAGAVEYESFEKFAEANPELTRQAAELGYAHGQLKIAELQQAAAQQGYTDTVALLKQAAAQDHFEKNASEDTRTKFASLQNAAASGDAKALEKSLEKLAETEEGREVVAQVQKGFHDTMEKIASAVYEQGFQDTMALLKEM